MIEKIRKMKNQKGFTLVELIVVLVILAILAALLIPALTGYIDKANKEKVVSETRMVAMAVQTEASEAYGNVGAGNLPDKWEDAAASDGINHIDSIKKLAEVLESDTKKFTATVSTDGAIVSVTYDDGTYNCTYTAKTKTYKTVKSGASDATAVDNIVYFKAKSGS